MKNMHSRMAELQQIFRFAHDYSNMDTVFTDPSRGICWEFMYSQIPDALQPYFNSIRPNLNPGDSGPEPSIKLHSTSFRLNFISVHFYADGTSFGSLIVGPFLLDEPSVSSLNTVLLEHHLPITFMPLIEQYYLSLPLISSDKTDRLVEFLSFLSSHFHQRKQQSPLKTIQIDVQNEFVRLPDTVKEKTDEAILTINDRYRTENKLLSVIENGSIEKLDAMQEELAIFSKLPDRIPNNPLRSRKNLAFVTNTLLRKAAEQGGVHPVYIDSISEKFAIQIEKTTSIQQLSNLHDKMLYEYCETVRKLSLKYYSPVIRTAIEYIRLHLAEPLRLEAIATAVHVSPSDLSRQFKKETGQPLTSYINSLRIREALQIIRSEPISITDIAQMVGFSDVNYFTKVFKQLQGVTPSDYRKTLQCKAAKKPQT